MNLSRCLVYSMRILHAKVTPVQETETFFPLSLSILFLIMLATTWDAYGINSVHLPVYDTVPHCNLIASHDSSEDYAIISIKKADFKQCITAHSQ